MPVSAFGASLDRNKFFNNGGRVSGYDRAGWDIFRDDASSRNDGVMPDGDITQYNGIDTDKHIMLEHDFTPPNVRFIRKAFIDRCIMGNNRGPISDMASIPNGDAALIRRVDLCSVGDEYVLTYGDAHHAVISHNAPSQKSANVILDLLQHNKSLSEVSL